MLARLSTCSTLTTPGETVQAAVGWGIKTDRKQQLWRTFG